MAARTSAFVAWMCVAICAVAAVAAGVLFGNTNPSGWVEFDCAMGMTQYCQQMEQTAHLHQVALYSLVGAGLASAGFLVWAVISTLVALNESDARRQQFAMPTPPHPGYYAQPMPPFAPPFHAGPPVGMQVPLYPPPYAAPSAPLPQPMPPSSTQTPPNGPA